MADLTQRMYQKAVVAALGTSVVVHDGVEVDLGIPEWPRITLYGAVSEALGEEVTTETPIEQVRKFADKREVHWDPKWGQGKLVQEIFEALVEHTLIQPTFVMDYPLETSPLTRQHRDNPLLTEKWDLIGFGTELGTAYSELVDPIEQRRRLVEQSLLAAGGDPEAMQLDEDFLQRPGVRHAAHGRHGRRHRPDDHGVHRQEHPRDDPVPAGQADPLTRTATSYGARPVRS